MLDSASTYLGPRILRLYFIENTIQNYSTLHIT